MNISGAAVSFLGVVALSTTFSCSPADDQGEATETAAANPVSPEAEGASVAEWIPPPSVLTIERLKGFVGVDHATMVGAFGESKYKIGPGEGFKGVIGGVHISLRAVFRDGLSRSLSICTSDKSKMTADAEVVPYFEVRGDRYWLSWEPPCVEIRHTELPTGKARIAPVLRATRSSIAKAIKKSLSAFGDFEHLGTREDRVELFRSQLWNVKALASFDDDDRVMAFGLKFEKWVDVPASREHLMTLLKLDGPSVKIGSREFVARFRKDHMLGFERVK